MARHQPTITCQRCATDFQTSARWAKSQKYCKLCQVIRDDDGYRPLMAKPRQCSHCDRKFFAIRAGQNWTKCGYCDQAPLDECVRCTLCANIARPAAGLLATCLGCVQSSEERRSQYLAHIRVTATQRREDSFAAAGK